MICGDCYDRFGPLRAKAERENLTAKLGKYVGRYILESWHTYFIRAGDDGPIKIGKTKDLEARICSLSTANAEKLNVLASIEAPKVFESQLHAYFDRFRLRGEWFKPDPEVLKVVELIKAGQLDAVLDLFEQRISENK